MIANITTIIYILSVSDEIINNGTLQKGTAISRIDDGEGIQIYKYYNYLTSPNNTESEMNNTEAGSSEMNMGESSNSSNSMDNNSSMQGSSNSMENNSSMDPSDPPMEGNSTNSSSSEGEETIGPVRFLTLWLLDSSDALAMWAPPNGTTTPITYTAEITYDGNSWRRLSLEEPDSTFADFGVTPQTKFQFRVTPNNGAPAMETFTPKKGTGKLGKMRLWAKIVLE